MHKPTLNSDFYGIRALTFTPYEPLLLGVGVVSNILKHCRLWPGDFMIGGQSSHQEGQGIESLVSRLSFPATGPPDPGRVLEGVSEGVSEGSLKGFLKGF